MHTQNKISKKTAMNLESMRMDQEKRHQEQKEGTQTPGNGNDRKSAQVGTW